MFFTGRYSRRTVAPIIWKLDGFSALTELSDYVNRLKLVTAGCTDNVINIHGASATAKPLTL